MPYDHSFQAKVMQALDKGLATALGPVFQNRVYSMVAPPNAAFPLMVYQQQDLYANRNDFFNKNGWSGLMTFRCIDTTLSGARNKLIEASQALQTVTLSGYLFQITLRAPQQFPVERTSTTNYYTSAVLADVEVYKDED